MTTLYVDNIAPNLQSKISAPNLTLPTGSVIQVLQQENNSLASFSGQPTGAAPHYDVFSLSITPSSTSSKILVLGRTSVGAAGTSNDFSVGLKRNGTLVGGNTSSSNWLGSNIMASGIPGSEAPMTLNFEYLDSPSSTSAVSYTICVWGGEQTTYYVNRGNSVNSTRTWANSGGSCLTLMEIAG